MKRGPRQTVFVASCIINSKIVTSTIEAETSEEAISIFEQENKIKPEHLSGPFFRKKTGVLTANTAMIFTGESKKLIYDGWHVNAMILSVPQDSAYILFENRVDNKKITKPQPIIIKIESLK